MKYSICEIDEQSTWENFVISHCPGALFQSWAWGNVQKKLGAKVWRLGFYDSNRLTATAQTVKVSAKRGNFLHVRHGPIMATRDQSAWKFLWNHLKNLAKKESCWFIRTNPVIHDTPENRRLMAEIGGRPSPIHAMDAELCWVLDLGSPEAELLKAMRKTTRYEIKRAQSLNLDIRQSDKEEDLANFLSLYKDTASRHHFVPHVGLREEFNEFVKKGNGILLLGYEGKRLLAGAVILFYANQAIYHHGASIPTKTPIAYAIQWEAIKLAKSKGLSVYNFWGIAPPDKPSHPWQGITLFKKGFGGSSVSYIHAYDIPLSGKYIITKSIEILRRVVKGY